MLFGLLLAMGYVVVALGYGRLHGQSRPLFDGFAPPPPYDWVHPPKEFAGGNTVPKESSFDVPLTAAGSGVASGSSDDGQVVLSFAKGVFAGHAADTKVVVHMTPLDPAGLGAPPTGLLADGNAYKLDFTYQPSGQAVTALTATSDIFLVVPQPAQTLLFSADGQAWNALPFRPAADPTEIGGGLSAPGYLLGVAPPVGPPTLSANANNDPSRVVAALAVTIGIALALWLIPFGIHRLRGSVE